MSDTPIRDRHHLPPGFDGPIRLKFNAFLDDVVAPLERELAAMKGTQSETTSMIYSAAERIEGGKVKLHLAPPPIWDGCVTFDSECVINGYHVPAGTTWNVILRSEVK